MTIMVKICDNFTMKRLHISIENSQYAALEVLSERTGASKALLIRQILSGEATRVRNDQIRPLQNLAGETNQSVAQIVQTAVDNYFVLIDSVRNLRQTFGG